MKYTSHPLNNNVDLCNRLQNELLREIQDCIYIIDNNFKVCYTNKVGETSYQRQLKKNLSLGSEFNFNEKFLNVKINKDRLLSGKSVTFRYKAILYRRKRTFEVSINPLFEHNTIIGFSIIEKDITKKIQLERKYTKLKTQLDDSQQIADIGYWSYDINKDEITWSENLYKIFGFDKSVTPSYQCLMSIIHEDDKEYFNSDVERAIRNKVKHDIIHRIIVNGEVRYVRQKGIAYYNKKGEAVRMVGITKDKTEIIKSQQKILNQNKELENFIHVLSHNLKRPIANLQALIDLYEFGLNKINDGVVNNLSIATETLNITIKDLNLSLTHKNVSQDQLLDVNFDDIFKDVRTLLKKEINESNAMFQIKTEVATIKGIKSYHVNILYNLILNSIEYRKKNRPPIILISTFEDKKNYYLTVTDNGIGMRLTPERKRKIFNMYGRLSGETSGRGFGLYLVKTQVEALNGSIDVESTIDEGSRFTLKFPKSRKSSFNEEILELI